MAKRKRLTPAQGLELDADGTTRFARETSEAKSMLSPLPPIAGVAGDAARQSALDEMAGTLEAARAEGRLAEALPLDAIVEDHLIRDRARVDEGEMDALVDSLRARGQQVPIEVTDLGNGRYGLISGWRRLQALRRLAADGQGTGTVAAFLRRPDGDAAAYLAMVEENEIRADLGFWERGRIVARSVESGVFETTKEALNGLFGSVPRARRSKIGSFVTLVRALDGVLRFPESLSERSGLALAKRLKAAEESGEGSDAAVSTLKAALTQADPESAQAEGVVLSGWASGGKAGRAEKPRTPKPTPQSAVRVSFARIGGRDVITLIGPGVDVDLQERLEAWLARGAGG